jgi:formimidoylglutamate deiminase
MSAQIDTRQANPLPIVSSTLWAPSALLPDGWARDVRVTVRDGRIAQVERGVPCGPRDQRTGTLLPAPVNAHVHSFQRALAGRTERRGPDPRDTFWTWRTQMFRFLERLTPEDVAAISAFVQVELLEAGYAAVCEFHYLHHDVDGRPYADVAELSGRVIEAAARTGIGLTLLPVLYQVGGCDGRPLGPGQRRFGNEVDDFARLAERAHAGLAALPPDAGFGLAPHSLRAVTPDGLAACVALAPGAPLHLHLAEQPAEVDEVLAARGARPVEWLLDAHAVDARWTLVHCTQMQPHETERLARTGATAALCPLTEANLGDGIFDGVRWRQAGGAIAIGADSCIRIALAEELRALETSQRLRDHARAVYAEADRSTGRVLLEAAVQGGARAAGRDARGIAAGGWADLLALDDAAVHLEGLQEDTRLDAWLLAGDDRLVRDVWSAGRHVVREGRHVQRASVEAAYRATMARVADA